MQLFCIYSLVKRYFFIEVEGKTGKKTHSKQVQHKNSSLLLRKKLAVRKEFK